MSQDGGKVLGITKGFEIHQEGPSVDKEKHTTLEVYSQVGLGVKSRQKSQEQNQTLSEHDVIFDI